MVCASCSRKLKPTTLATSTVTRKSDTLASSGISYTSKPSASSSGPSGIGKSKLLSKAAKNPYAAYSANCEKCHVKVSQGYKFCHKCSFKANACAGCGKKEKKAVGDAGVVEGMRFSAK